MTQTLTQMNDILLTAYGAITMIMVWLAYRLGHHHGHEDGHVDGWLEKGEQLRRYRRALENIAKNTKAGHN